MTTTKSPKPDATYPYESPLGPTTVLGPECFINEAKSTICYRGENYRRSE